MKVVRVQYTVTPAYAGKNQENIAAIVGELKTLNHPGIKYWQTAKHLCISKLIHLSYMEISFLHEN
jgi:hypothetical protein